MSRLPMLENIFAQPGSHRGLLEFHAEEGKENLEACARLLRAVTGRVIVSGMGASLFAAIPAVARLTERGVPAQLSESSELLHYGSAALKAGDAGVLISRSGGSVEVVRLAEKMRAAGMTVVGVTNVHGSELERLADVTLTIGSKADQLVAVQTYAGTVITLLLLAEQVVTGDSGPLNQEFGVHLSSLTTHIEACFAASEHWQELFDSNGALYLLGRGPALASVYEGALLLHETAKAAAVGMSSGQFRHGPVEWVSSESRIVVFGSPETTRSLDWSLTNDLFRMGSKVRWIGTAVGPGAGSPLPLIEWPEVPSLLAPIFDIVPLQVAAYRLALWRGVVPGDFRYASEITLAESGFPLFQSRLAST